MKKFCWILLLIASSSIVAQTSNKNLNSQLQKMKTYLLAGDYENFADYTYPKVVEMMGGKSNMVSATKQAFQQMNNDGFFFTDVTFKDSSDFLKKNGELQCALTQVIRMKTPEGKIESEYSLLAISSDSGSNRTFIDTSGKDKETMLKYFPNLHSDISIKPKKQKFVE